MARGKYQCTAFPCLAPALHGLAQLWSAALRIVIPKRTFEFGGGRYGRPQRRTVLAEGFQPPWRGLFIEP
jgi:hypothetical protein